MPRIVPYPHPSLRYESRPLERIDDDLRASVRAMFDLMYEARGIGLAANQVALPYRFFILNVTADPLQKDQEQVFINPEIVKRHSSVEEEEGCLRLQPAGSTHSGSSPLQDPGQGVRPSGQGDRPGSRGADRPRHPA